MDEKEFPTLEGRALDLLGKELEAARKVNQELTRELKNAEETIARLIRAGEELVERVEHYLKVMEGEGK